VGKVLKSTPHPRPRADAGSEAQAAWHPAGRGPRVIRRRIPSTTSLNRHQPPRFDSRLRARWFRRDQPARGGARRGPRSRACADSWAGVGPTPPRGWARCARRSAGRP